MVGADDGPDYASEGGKARKLTGSSRLLSSQRRLYALVCLREAGGPLTLTELAAEVTARERDVPPGELSSDNVQRTRLSLYHVHVPKLAGAGVVHYDHEASAVELGEWQGDVEVLVDAVFGGRPDGRSAGRETLEQLQSDGGDCC